MTDIYTLVSRAKSQGYSVEIFESVLYEIQIKREKQYQSMKITNRGYGVRVVKDGKLGFAFGNKLDNLLDLAIESLNASKEDKYNVLPSPESVNKMNLKFFDISEAMEKVKEMLSFGNELREHVNILSEYYEALTAKIKVVNSEGIDVEEERSLVSVSLAFNVKNDKEVSPEIYESISSRTLSLDLEKLKDKILRKKEIYSRDRIKLEKASSEAEFTPKALSELFSPLFSHSISLENYYRGKSTLKEGELLNPIVEITDNPFINTAPYSRSFDAEGLPSKQSLLIRDGIVNQFLSNTYWSLKANKENTHSASRPYSSIPYISPSILEIDVKNSSDSDNLIVVDQIQGVHTSNFDTGEFSVVVPIAWNEKEGKAYRELTLTGNIKDFIKGIEGKTSKDKELYGNLFTPSIKVRGVNVL